MSFNIWEGIYNDFRECPSIGDGYESDTWVSRSAEKVKKILDEAGQNKPVSSDPESLLPFLTAMVLEKTKEISILDFGGGIGCTYMSVISRCEKNHHIDFHIVESKKVCDEGTRIFKDDGRVHFYISLPPKTKTMDLVHLGSSIHYIEDWRSLLKKLSEYKPLYFLFEDVPAGAISTYATVQNYYGSKIPCWFFNIDEIICTMESLKFKLLYRSPYAGIYLGQKQKVPQNNFPEEYRIGDTCNLLFAKESI